MRETKPERVASGGSGMKTASSYGKNPNPSTTIKQNFFAKFEGRNESLSGYTFDVTTARDSDRYLRTLNEIARYAGATLRHGGDIQRTIEESKIFRIPMPSRPTPVDEDSNEEEILVHEFETDVYREEVKNFVKRKSTLQDNMSKIHSLLWGQCSEPMRAKVKAMLAFEVVKEKMDMIGLLDLIRKST